MKISIKDKKVFSKKIELQVRKLLNGDLLLNSHPEMDIVVSIEGGEVHCYPKPNVGYDAYSTQDRFMEYLTNKGIVQRDSIRAGSVSNSIMGSLLPTTEKGVDPYQVCILGIYNFLNKEEPYFQILQDFEEGYEEDLLDPDVESSTELGEVPHIEQKGSVPPGKYYGYGYGYRPYVYESVKKD